MSIFWIIYLVTVSLGLGLLILIIKTTTLEELDEGLEGGLTSWKILWVFLVIFTPCMNTVFLLMGALDVLLELLLEKYRTKK